MTSLKRLRLHLSGASSQPPDSTTVQSFPEVAQVYHEALQAARHRQTTAEVKEQYALRAGIEGTLSQGVRAFDLRRARYIGLAQTHLQHILSAVAINVVRVVSWLTEPHLSKPRVAPFAALAAPV